MLKSKRVFGGFEYQDCSPPPAMAERYVTLYSLTFDEPRIWPKDAAPADGAAGRRRRRTPTGALRRGVEAPVVPVGVAAPPQDAAITNASARTAELLFFTTEPP